MFPEDLGFENGGADLAFCPGRHLTSLRPCQSGEQFRQGTHPLTFMLQNYDADKLRTHELSTLAIVFQNNSFIKTLLLFAP